MARFIFFTDAHISGMTPRHRVDNYQQALLKKIEEVYDLAKKHSCEFLVFGGDLFDTHRIFSYEVISGLMDIICDSGLKTYSIIGQHDLYGYNPETFKSSTLAFVIKRCGLFEIIWQPSAVCGVNLFPSHVWQDVNESLKATLPTDHPNVLIAHCLFTNKKLPYNTISTEDFGKTSPYDLVLAGDLHCGFETHRVNKSWFCNPASLARQEINEADRIPKVALISIQSGSDPEIEMIPLKSARPGVEVFGENVADIFKSETKDTGPANNFVDDLLQFEAESVDIYALIRKIGMQRGISKDVLNYIEMKRAEALASVEQ